MQRYGWIPDLPDKRDVPFTLTAALVAPLPAKVDLREKCPPVYSQRSLGSCTANAICAAHEFEQLRQGAPHVFTPSRLFVYYNEREMMGTVNLDSGAYLRDGMKSISRQGVCPETSPIAGPSGDVCRVWPYIIERWNVRPHPGCYDCAKDHQALVYSRLRQVETELKSCLAQGHPFVFGFTVYESLETRSVERAGVVPMPSTRERVLGGHAVMAVGYDDDMEWFIVRNSWGVLWGDHGHCYMPYKYVLDDDLAADFWTIRLVEVPANV